MTANEQPPMMPLRVTRNDEIADGINLIEFRDLNGKELPEFSAGAHIASIFSVTPPHWITTWSKICSTVPRLSC